MIQAAGQVNYDAAPIDDSDVVRTLRFGDQIDVRAVHGQADRENTTGSELTPRNRRRVCRKVRHQSRR